ncbi:hypothetical protein Scep_020123 [Stephania cephalantha]|uniref:Uncharacterized protein n=1 Tax=Stephania cephalantha TaxID=152367 RepID=A0AAP0IC33_9MAGN
MELMKFGEEKRSPRRESRLSRGRSQKAMRSNILEAIAQMQGGSIVSRRDEDGTLRMKIVVKKQDLKHFLGMMGSGNNIYGSNNQASLSSLTTLEQRLHVLRSRQVRRSAEVAKTKSGSGPWRPALQSIPEEP